jgi:hypothetical protein
VAGLDPSLLTEDTTKKMLLVEALIDMFQVVVVVHEALCLLVAAQEDVALVPAAKVEEIKIRLVAAAEVAEEEPVLSEQTLLDLRRLKRNWTLRWRITSTPMVELQSLPQKLPQKLLHQPKRPPRRLTLMTLI